MPTSANKRNILKGTIYMLILAIPTMGCKKPYNPPAAPFPGGYLVVDGVINSGADSTFIKLSKTVGISQVDTPNAVLQATVAVESDQNNIYPLTESGNGNYAAAGLNLNSAHHYRLTIKTADGQQYASDYEPVTNTPPIDSIGFIIQPDGLQLYVNTHDPSNAVNYYRWDYKETWQFHSKYESFFITNGKAIVPRTPDQDIYSCFGNDTSSTVLLASSAKLKQAVIYQSPLTRIPSTSEKIETKYSILVNQYGLTGDAYNFWTNLKQNTEQLGSIFAPQPSENNGNIHCISSPAQPVIGYISVCNVQQKRIFISNSQVPGSWLPTYPYVCTLDTAQYCTPPHCVNAVAQLLIPLGSLNIPLISFGGGFFIALRPCADCTIRGTKQQPAFWK